MTRLKVQKSRGLVAFKGKKIARLALAGVSGSATMSRSVDFCEAEGFKSTDFQKVGGKIGFCFKEKQSQHLMKDAIASLGESDLSK